MGFYQDIRVVSCAYDKIILLVLDPVLASKVKRDEIGAAFAARFSPRQVRNPDLTVIASIFNLIKGSAASKLICHIDDVITECLDPKFKLGSANVGQKYVFNALQLLSVQSTEAERTVLQYALPVLDAMRDAPGQGASSVATFKSEYKELNDKSAKYPGFVAAINEAYKGVVGYRVTNTNEIEFKDQGHIKRLRLINTGSMGAVFLVTDASGNPIKVIRTICVGDHKEHTAARDAGLMPYPERRAAQFKDYQSANAPNALLQAGNFHQISSKGRVHTIESFSHCSADMLATRLKDSKVDPMQDLIAVAASLAEIHKAGLVATNLKPDNIHIETKPALNARFVNPSLFRHHSKIFDEYFAGSTALRYYGEDFLDAFSGNPIFNSSAEIANKTDLRSFGVLLFQALTGSWLFGESQHLSAEVMKPEESKQYVSLEEISKLAVKYLLESKNVAPHIKAASHVKNIFAWSAAKSTPNEIKARVREALTSKGFSEKKVERIENLLVDLITLKPVAGKYIMAKADGSAPTAEWVLSEMQAISGMS